MADNLYVGAYINAGRADEPDDAEARNSYPSASGYGEASPRPGLVATLILAILRSFDPQRL